MEKKDEVLPEETMKKLDELALVLKDIYIRLKSEGYVLKDGELIPPEDKEDSAV